MNEKKNINNHIKTIKEISNTINKKIKIMEICGGHTNSIMKYGIRDILPKNIELVSGPGCPVCVSSGFDIDSMIELAHNNIPIATYGDMLKVPGSKYNLEDARAKGAKVFEIYSTIEVLKLKEKYPNIVFFGIGFETTAPMTTLLLKNNICVYSVHKLVIPAVKVLVNKNSNINGFLQPGHVSTVIGTMPYKEIKIPQVISGFSAEQILRSLTVLLKLIKENNKTIINAYPEVVSKFGNKNAQKKLKKYFKIVDSEWRGLGLIKNSGLEVKNDKLNAKIKYKNIFKNVKIVKNTKCKCGEILMGLMQPKKCPLYKIKCTPNNPLGACMVSNEGSCAISYRYNK
jgi:hydrogenase expression/formation protein HypD